MRARVYLGLAGVGLGLAIVAAALAGPPVLPVTWPQPYEPSARTAVLTALANQAANGAVVDQTVWNHFFKEREDERPDILHPSGVAFLDRLARRAAGDPGCGPLRLFVQRSQYFVEVSSSGTVTYPPGAYIPGKPRSPQEMVAKRAEQDRLRLEAVRQYLAVNWPQVAVQVELNDPPPTGIPAREGLLIYTPSVRGVFGFLPLPIQGGLSIAPEKLARGTPGNDVPSVQGTAPVSAFGSEAASSSPGPGPGGP
jgi:hypothetical protein